nr:hypothetical protein [Tanacetum cinerariifolium]
MENQPFRREDVRMMMIRKDPPLDQIGGLRDEEKVGCMHQPALYLNQLPGVQGAVQGSAQSWISELAKQTDARSSFNKLLDTSIDFSNFIMNWLDGRRVIPFEHFIDNDLEYLRGGASSRKYTTSVTKTKAADYGHIKEFLTGGGNVSSSMGSLLTGNLLSMYTP